MGKEKRKFNYKWVILAVCFLMNFVCLGFTTHRSLYLSAITEALGFERSLFALNDTFRYATLAIINFFFGGLMQRIGARKMIAVGFVALCASMITAARAESVVVFYISGILLGVGLACTTTTITGSIIRRWFKKNIGRYTGLALAANGIGGAVSAQIISPMISDPIDPFGYRNAYLVCAAIIAVAGIVVMIFLRERPKNETLEVIDTKKRRGTAWEGIPLQTALRRPYFYVSAAIVFLTGFMLQGIGGVYAAHLGDVGFDPGIIATVTSVYSLTLTLSKISVGFLYDRLGLRFVMILCQGASAVSLVLLVVLAATPLGTVMAFAFAILYALSLPLETLVIPLIVNDLFGSAAFDKLFGVFAALNYAGYAVSAPVVNLCFDTTGSYNAIFLLFAGLTVLAGLMIQFMITAANKVKRQMEAAKQ